jgi:hypothetical protein
MEHITPKQILQELQDINNKFTEMGFPISVFHAGERHPIEGIDVFYAHDKKTRQINGIHSVDFNTAVEAKTLSEARAINNAKEVLRKAGYYMDNLWHLDDVQMLYKCNDEQAMAILEDAVGHEESVEQVFHAIKYKAQELNLKPTDDNE